MMLSGYQIQLKEKWLILQQVMVSTVINQSYGDYTSVTGQAYLNH